MRVEPVVVRLEVDVEEENRAGRQPERQTGDVGGRVQPVPEEDAEGDTNQVGDHAGESSCTALSIIPQCCHDAVPGGAKCEA